MSRQTDNTLGFKGEGDAARPPPGRRWSILGGPMLAVALVLAAAWLLSAAWQERRADEIIASAKLVAQGETADVRRDILGVLGQLRGIPSALAGEDLIRDAALHPRDRAIQEHASAFLHHVAQTLGVDLAWLMDDGGTCLAANNTDEPTNLVGGNFADRPYFKAAQHGTNGLQFTNGRRSAITGFTMSAPIVADGRFVGTVGIKASLPAISRQLSHKGAIITDAYGIVILAEDPAIIYSAMPEATVSRLTPQERLDRYARQDFPQLAVQPGAYPGHPEAVRVLGRRAVLQSAPLGDTGFTATVAGDLQALDALDGERRLLFFATAAGGLLLIAAVAVAVAFRRRVRVQQQHLRAGRDFTAAILNSVTSHVAILDRNGTILEVNRSWRAYAEAHGMPPGWDGVGTNYLEVCRAAPPAQSPEGERVAEGLAAVLDGHRDSFDLAYPCPEGERPRWFRLRATPLAGVPGLAVVTHEEITDLKLAEQAMRISEERLALAAEGAHVGVWDRDVVNDRVVWDSQMLALYGLTETPPEKLTQAFWLSCLHPDDRARAAAAALEAMLTGAPYADDFRVVWPNGEIHHLRARGRTLLDANGAPLRMLGVNYDVTESRVAQEQLALANQFLDRILNLAPDPIFVKDRQHRWLLLNDAYCSFVGRQRELLLGKTDHDLFPKEQADFFHQTDEQVFDSGEEAISEEQLTDLYGVHHTVVTKKVAFTDPQGRRLIVGTMRDVTRQRQAQSALNAAKAAAEQASRAKSEFLANMSHEIRTPMNAILVLIRLLEDATLDRRERDYVARMKLSAQSLLGILNDILDFSKIEAGRLELERTVFTLEDTLAGVAAIVSTNADEKQVETVFRLGPGVPRQLVGDPLRLQQVLLNLAGNAVKFTEKGEVVITIGVAESRDEEITLSFAVADTGIGIAAERQDRLFQAFWQADSSTSRKYGGSGLGLAISSRLVGLMGGNMRCQSRPGEGSEFSFTARFGRVPAAGDETAAPAGGSRRLLVVDDNATARQALADMAMGLGWQVTEAAGAEVALVLLRAQDRDAPMFTALLVDNEMPDGSGFDLLRCAVDLDLPLPPVVLMAPASRLDAVRAAGGPLPVTATLAKPVLPTALEGALAGLGCPAPAAAAAPAPPHSGPGSLQGRLGGLRLLLVEDNEINQEVERAILQRAGASVVIAGDGRAAVERLRTEPDHFDAVLMDIQMPGMDGYEATKRIRAELGMARLPVIAMTANAMAEDQTASQEAGMDAHIAKPIDIEKVIATLFELGCIGDPALAARGGE